MMRGMIPWWFTRLVDWIVRPFGYQVMVVATWGFWGADRLYIIKEGRPVAVRLKGGFPPEGKQLL